MPLIALLAFLVAPIAERAPRRGPRRVARLELLRDAAAAALDRLPIGVILLDERGVVMARNRSAERILDLRDGLTLEDGVLAGTTPVQTLALHRALETAPSGGERSLSLSRPSGRLPLELLVVSGRAEGAPSGEAPGLLTLFVTDPAEAAEPDTEVLRRLYGLTRAEAGFAALLAQGRKVEEIAEIQHISLHTARGHLKSVFAKTRTHRQANLVRLLVTGPAQLRLGI